MSESLSPYALSLIAAGLAFAIGAAALWPEISWELQRLRRARRIKRKGGWL